MRLMAKSLETEDTLVVETAPEGPSYPDPVKTIIWNAIYENATDVHFNVTQEGMLVLYRVDGMIHQKRTLTAAEGRKIVNQIKAAASLDTVKSFLPKEGQIKWPDGEKRRDIRITIVPVGKETVSAHLRLLTLPSQTWAIANLGFLEDDLSCISSCINSRGGLILISGMTGAGKTTTMYSFASLLDLRSNVAFSIEDPVEFDLPYAQQLEVDERHGFTMHEGLQTILRTDPDLVMVGEIRDRDSAVVAARAALSGRLVLATIHAQDAAGTVDALHYLGVPYYIIGASAKLIVSQNLLRRLCGSCAEERSPSSEERGLFEQFGLDVPETIFRANGCEECESYGYRGRIAIFEVAKFEPDTAHLIADGIHQTQLRNYLRKNDVRPMLADGLRKVAQGLTSMEELYRVCDIGSNGGRHL